MEKKKNQTNKNRKNSNSKTTQNIEIKQPEAEWWLGHWINQERNVENTRIRGKRKPHIPKIMGYNESGPNREVHDYTCLYLAIRGLELKGWLSSSECILLLWRNVVHFAAPSVSSSRPPTIPAPWNLLSSSGLEGRLQSWAHTQTNTQKHNSRKGEREDGVRELSNKQLN